MIYGLLIPFIFAISFQFTPSLLPIVDRQSPLFTVYVLLLFVCAGTGAGVGAGVGLVFPFLFKTKSL